MAACQRYYVRYSNSSINYVGIGVGQVTGTNTGIVLVSPVVSMRVVPTSIEYSNLGMQENWAGGIGPITALIVETNTTNLSQIWLAATSSSAFTSGKVLRLLGNNSTSAYLGMSAEL